MIDETKIKEIKDFLKDYLEEKGLNTKTRFNCLNPTHEDKHPSMSYDDRRKIVKCFSCNSSYDLISLYAQDNNLDSKKDFKRIVEELALKYNLKTMKTKSEQPKQFINKQEKTDNSKYYKQCSKDLDKTDYLTKRGLSEKILKKYNIGYDIQKQAVILPVSKYFYEERTTNPQNKVHHIKRGQTELFNGHYLKNSDFKSVVWVTEAIIDALSLEEINQDIKTISLNSIDNAKQLINEAQYNNFKGMFILALDTDTPGLKASLDLKEELDLIGIKTIIFNRDKDKFSIVLEDGQTINNKDINEYLISNRDKLKNDVTGLNDMAINMLEQQAIRLYEKENAFSYLDEFKLNIEDQKNNKPISTGIKKLDDALGGGFFRKNLVILGAISSLGKTTLALQIADNIARQGNDILIFSLEMSKDELIAKSLSRLSYLKAYDKRYTALAFATMEILTGKGTETKTPNNEQRIDIFNEALKDYKENIAQQVYITECNENLEININTISDKIKNHIAITGKKPFVVIDYLQIIQNQEKGLTDKQAIDRIVIALKRIARENDITILLISAFNRASYNQESNLASFRDSSTIEYTSDVLISLQHEKLDGVTEDKKINTNKEQQKDERDLTLKVLKNRNGRITDVKNITFYAKYNYMFFKEQDY